MSFPSFSSFPELPTNSAPALKQKERRRRDKAKPIQNDPDVQPPKERKERRTTDEQADSTSRLFYSDRKGDPLNIQYGGLHSREVPKYHSGRHILGLPPSFSVLYRTSHGVEVGLPGKRKMPSLTDTSSRALLSRNPTRSLVNATASSSKYEEHDGFLRLPSRSANEQAYRAIDKSNGNSDSESDSGQSDAGDSSEEETPNSHQVTLRTINEKLAVDSRSISNWLSLLSHTLLAIPTTSKNATRARSEISISILSRALEAAGNSSILRIRYLQAGEEIWHDSKLRAEWEDALKKVTSGPAAPSGGVEIWMEWFEWRIRKSNKGISAVVEDAKRALAALYHDEVAQVRIFWRLAVAFQNTGFGERATAMFQAQAELVFQIPQALYGLPLARRLDSLEEFWESECPRIGEAGATGWDTWFSSGRPSMPPASPPKPPPIEDLDPYRKFGFSESLADRALFLPRRSTDIEADSDPYSIILFSDIRDVLLNLDSADAKDLFRHAWLMVLGLNLPGFKVGPRLGELEPDTSMDLDDRWCHTYLLRPAYLDAVFPSNKGTVSRIMSDAVTGVIVGREREYASGLGGPISSWGWGVIRSLEVPSSDGRTRALWSKEDLKGVNGPFVRNVFSQLRLGNGDLDWDLFSLAFEATTSVKSALKLSRGFLSTAPDSLLHWAAHARLEQLRGRPDDARKVYETVLSSHVARPETGRLWCDWAEMEWLARQPDAALKVVLRSAGVDGSGGVMLLRAKRSLDDNANGVQHWPEREPWVKLRALLELLTNNAPATLHIFDGHLSAQKVGSTNHERLTVEQLLMLYRHGAVLKNPTPPALLRERVEESLKLYPSNSVLLGLFLEGERGQGVWGKVRAMLGESAGGLDKDVLRRIQEVWIAGWDKGRWEAEVERTRSGLAAAVESERTRRSVIIWRIFIEFEIRVGQLNRAKKLLFRAIGECPLVKELYLVAFGPLRAVFSAQELNGFADTMAERELRLRQGLDEFLEGWEEKEGSESAEDVDSGDEIEVSAKEYRLRLPY
ncbi:NRDE-2, necessary for RNA interference-domain-containing protein [Mycena maculata]|uniref:NRDE-2, necessary for RNA interference-domain-containing protein n=1 Tax=Mycena maculata TaxID=230809 RepID=A0AAD7P195_9AGAR|nr:NRDE-2, necessary for RNA interference-domain-containing protein [Mycena maculata]